MQLKKMASDTIFSLHTAKTCISFSFNKYSQILLAYVLKSVN